MRFAAGIGLAGALSVGLLAAPAWASEIYHPVEPEAAMTFEDFTRSFEAVYTPNGDVRFEPLWLIAVKAPLPQARTEVGAAVQSWCEANHGRYIRWGDEPWANYERTKGSILNFSGFELQSSGQFFGVVADIFECSVERGSYVVLRSPSFDNQHVLTFMPPEKVGGLETYIAQQREERKKADAAQASGR